MDMLHEEHDRILANHHVRSAEYRKRQSICGVINIDLTTASSVYRSAQQIYHLIILLSCILLRYLRYGKFVIKQLKQYEAQ